jgi:tetratricopeptide (TPR) repeat protein
MIRQTETGLGRWQEDVARDPGSPSFVPLADLYRTQGRLDIARRVCIRGLERHPTHVEGHFLLGRIYRDEEDREKAYDEWDIALSLDPTHPASRRSLAFLCLEQGRMEEAQRHLLEAQRNDPDDPRIRRALRYIESGGAPVAIGPDYWDAVARLLKPRLEGFIREARVRLALVLDSSGRLLTQHGFTRDLDLAAFGSLAVGVHAAAKENARMMGQAGFTQLYQGRGDHQLFMGTIASPTGELLMVTVFGEEATIGLVRALFREFTGELSRTNWPAISSSLRRESLEAELAAGVARARDGAGAFAGKAG